MLLSQTPKFDVGAVSWKDGTNCALVGSKIVVIQRGSKALCYDVEKKRVGGKRLPGRQGPSAVFMPQSA